MNLATIVRVKQKIDEWMKDREAPLFFSPSFIYTCAKELDISYEDMDKALSLLHIELSHEYDVHNEVVLTHPSFLTLIPFMIEDIDHVIENGGLCSNGLVEVDSKDVTIRNSYMISNRK